MNTAPCRFCGTLGDGPHPEHCPTMDSNPVAAQGQWMRGFQYGYDDNRIPYYLLPRYNIWYRLGYLKGKQMIDEEVDNAAQAECSWQAVES